jgi:type VI protein secretion system component VasF
MRLSILFLAMAVLLGAAPQEEKKKEPFDPFANPTEELMKRAEKSAQEKRFNELKDAAAELKELSGKMSDEIESGGKDVVSAKIWSNLDRAEKLIKTMREKAK